MMHEVIVHGSVIWVSGFLITFVLTPLARNYAVRKKLMDRLGQFHTTHTVAVPRIGGVALAITFLIIVVMLVIMFLRPNSTFKLPSEIGLVFATSLAAFALGFWDDLRPIRAKTKLLVQVLIAFTVWAGGLRIEHWVNPLTHTMYDFGWLGCPLTILWLVSITNLINLVDGIDGLAAGLILMIMIVFSVVGVLGVSDGGGQGMFSLLLAVGMAGSLSAFLFYNFPPARIFLGDGGAYFMGMLIAEMSLLNSNKGEVAAALLVPFFALGLPIIDSCFTIFRRYMVGLPIFRADRRHIHHRLAGMGFSQRRVVLSLYGMCVLFALLALVGFVSKGRLLPVLLGIFMFVMIASARYFGFVRDWYKLGSLLLGSVARRKHTRHALLLGQLLLIESGECKSLKDLWKRYGEMLERLKFSSVVLHRGNEEMQWEASRSGASPEAEISMFHDLRGNPPSGMTFMCSPRVWDEDTFRLLSELAAEAWSRALEEWSRVHQGVS